MGRITGAAFYRYFLPALTGARRRVLYLDTDAWPENDAWMGLFEMDWPGDTPVAAVRDYPQLVDPGQPPYRYFNSGVMLIDVKAYARERLQETVIETAVRTGLHDQSAINDVLKGRWLELSPAFNLMGPWLLSPLAAMFPPSISHFAAIAKPWHVQFGLDHSARQHLLTLMEGSPWLGEVSPLGLTKWNGPLPQHRMEPIPLDPAIRTYAETTRFAAVPEARR